jgi:hypothetical protein
VQVVLLGDLVYGGKIIAAAAAASTRSIMRMHLLSHIVIHIMQLREISFAATHHNTLMITFSCYNLIRHQMMLLVVVVQMTINQCAV